MKWLRIRDVDHRRNYYRFISVVVFQVKKEVKKSKNVYWQRSCKDIDGSLGHCRTKQDEINVKKSQKEHQRNIHQRP